MSTDQHSATTLAPASERTKAEVKSKLPRTGKSILLIGSTHSLENEPSTFHFVELDIDESDNTLTGTIKDVGQLLDRNLRPKVRFELQDESDCSLVGFEDTFLSFDDQEVRDSVEDDKAAEGQYIYYFYSAQHIKFEDMTITDPERHVHSIAHLHPTLHTLRFGDEAETENQVFSILGFGHLQPKDIRKVWEMLQDSMTDDP